jgi:hypothetical protein
VKAYRVNVISLGVATIEAPTKAEAARRARAGTFDSYELQEPYAAIMSLGEGDPIPTGCAPVKRPVVFRSGDLA